MSETLRNMTAPLNSKMDSIKGVLFNKKFIVILLLISLFLAVAFYVYNNYIAPKMNPDFVPNREYTHEGESDVAELYLFHVGWCPYSKKAKPVWKKMKNKFDNKTINNITIRFTSIDGEKNSKDLEKFEDKYLNGKKVDGYPSIYMVKGQDVYEYEAKPSVKTLTEFINSVA